MAVSNLKFSADVDAWCKETEARMKAVRDRSVQRVVEIMQTPVGAGGNMPIKTGFLRAGLQASTDGPAPLDRDNPGQVHAAYNAGPIDLVIAGADLDATLYISYTANYAGHMEYGTSKFAGYGFVRLAAAQWQQVVSESIEEAKARAQ